MKEILHCVSTCLQITATYCFILSFQIQCVGVQSQHNQSVSVVLQLTTVLYKSCDEGILQGQAAAPQGLHLKARLHYPPTLNFTGPQASSFRATLQRQLTFGQLTQSDDYTRWLLYTVACSELHGAVRKGLTCVVANWTLLMAEL